MKKHQEVIEFTKEELTEMFKTAAVTAVNAAMEGKACCWMPPDSQSLLKDVLGGARLLKRSVIYALVVGLITLIGVGIYGSKELFDSMRRLFRG